MKLNRLGAAVATIDLTSQSSVSRASEPVAEAVRKPVTTGARGLRYIPGLDGIRAIAVLAVLLYHADVPWMPGGFLGVDMFFVLSGFLITSIVLTELDRTGGMGFKRFYVHRARRLLPALVLVLGFCALLVATLAPDAAAAFRRDLVGSLFYATNWVYILADQSYFEMIGRPPMLQHLWSLAVEEQFYLIWPAVAVFAWRRGGRHRVREWALIGALASTLLMVVLSLLGGFPEPNDGSRVYFGTDSHAMGLLLGAALATVWLPQRLKTTLASGARAIVDAAGFAALGLVLLVMMNSHSDAAWLYRGGFLVFAALVAVVIAVASHPASILGRSLGRQPLRYIGQRSYGLYLWHWPVFVVLRPGLDIPLVGLPDLLLRFAVTFGLAELSYRYVEMPIRHGALQRGWRGFGAMTTTDRQPILKKAAIIGGISVATIALVGFRVVTIPEETPDYLHGLQGLSALDATQNPDVPRHVKKWSEPTAVVGVAGAAGVAAGPTLSNTIVAPGTSTVRPGVLAIGESVMLGAQGGLREDFKKISIDAAVGRQAADIVTRVDQLRDAGALRQTVILHTGTNGYVERDQLKQILQVLSESAQRLVVVNVDVPREWETPNNDLIAELVAQTPNAVLADWHSHAQANPGLLVGDGVHLTEQGVKEYSQVINDALTQLTDAQAAAAPSADPSLAPPQ